MKKIIDIIIPIMVFIIWIAGIFLGIACLIGPFLEGEHWWELFYMWPIGLIHLFAAIGIPFVFASKSFKDTIKKSKEVI